MDGGTDWGNGITHHLLYAEYAQQGVGENLLVEFVNIYIGSYVVFYEKIPERDRYILCDMVELHLNFIGDETALQIDYTQVKHGASGAEFTQVYEVLSALLIKNRIAYVQITVQGGVGIGLGVYEMQDATSLFISQERILHDVLPALVLECGEESGRGCGGVEFFAEFSKFCGILLHPFGVDTQRASVRQLAVNAFELDGYAVIGRAYQLAGFGAGQSQIVHFTGPVILIEPHFLQLRGVEFEQYVGVVLFIITLTELSASGELVVL